MFPLSSYAQFTKGLNYRTETGISFSGGEHTPFWLTANKQGLSSIEKNSGYLRAGIFREMEDDKRFSYAFGADLAVAYNFSSSFIIQQLYADLKYRCLQLSIGSKERHSEFNNPFLSSGGLTFSGNTRPIPQVRIGIPEYTPVPGTKGWLAFKGHVAYGMFTDDGWQKDFVAPGNKYTEHVLYHSKDLYVKIGNREKFPLILEGGLEMAAQFGGNAYIGNDKTDMPNGIKDFSRCLSLVEAVAKHRWVNKQIFTGTIWGVGIFHSLGMLPEIGQSAPITNIISRITRRCSVNMVGKIVWRE